MWLTWLCFKAVLNDCETIWTYYEVAYGDRSKSLSNDVCNNAEALHSMWMIVNAVLLLLRFISLFYMIKGLLYLLKRAEEKQRKMQR